ncbi:hypothetical protein [Terriglobus aquaticus]|uniref:Etoposide-induced protein 2.4 (EI24) n=1 Tax=Terriglobus aquaticus TaxID=940139 RepID=A0ABW9KL41_9BACT|nr:hypothetical protein [Terriglobus aquaticus]
MAVHTAASPQRATQGFVANVTWAWRHPLVVLMEIGWRWLFGAPLLWMCWTAFQKALDQVPWQVTGVQRVSANQLLTDPMGAAAAIGAFVQMIVPVLERTALWAVPVFALVWVLLSSAGRTLVLRRLDPAMRGRWFVLCGLQAMRLVLSLVVAWVWWLLVQWMARVSIADPIARGGEPQMMLYTGGAIVITLGLFVLTGAMSWVFAAAPIVAMRENTGVFASLSRAARAQGARGGMVEINLVLSVVKIMLIVLSLAFSAFPLPFTTIVTEEYVLMWSGLVGLWYFAASDFFHVTRLHAFSELLRRHEVTFRQKAASE